MPTLNRASPPAPRQNGEPHLAWRGFFFGTFTAGTWFCEREQEPAARSQLRAVGSHPYQEENPSHPNGKGA